MTSNASKKSLINDEDRQSYRHHIIWLDKNLNNFSNKRKVNQLREIDPDIEGFTCEEECIDSIKRKDDKNKFSYIIFITSGSLSEKIIPVIQNYTCILAIYIFCMNVDNYNHLQFPKLRAICDDMYELMDRIENCIIKDNTREINFSLFNNQHTTLSESTSSTQQYPIRNLKEDQACFLWFYQCHNFMIKLDRNDDEQAKKEMIDYCRQQYQDDQTQKTINEFDNQSLEDNAKYAIWWYTHNSFVFRCINTVFRTENISNVYTCRYIIKLLCRQLKDQHEKYKRLKHNTSLRLYRGQNLELTQIHLIKKHINDLISLNGFVSTTLEEDIAREFSFRPMKEGFKPVLFEIDVDMPDAHNVIFADIRQLSKYPEEEEILFSVGTIFRIKSVIFDKKDELYKIHLSLNQHEQLTVTKYIEQTYSNDVNLADQSVLFGKFLFDMGECQFAIKYFKDALNRLSNTNDHLRATYLNNLGVCYNEIGKKNKALECYEEALEIYRKANNRRGLGACYHNIASIYHAQGEYNYALRSTLDALEYRQGYHLEKASTFDLLGCIYLAKKDTETARNNFTEALTLRSRCLGQTNPNHPDIGISYQNLGAVDKKESNFIHAQQCYSRAADIYRQNYPESHPLVKDITQCLEEVTRQLN